MNIKTLQRVQTSVVRVVSLSLLQLPSTASRFRVSRCAAAAD